ncbi:protein kinase family protein [Streptomyces sedi]|uniref:Protein kinase family protein n=1 Tax=Streptomyces sedi TaxID=555059 RepID=A0A5C4UWY7_9ACTN|nr:protein kinase family protein [Streptomyces sedi]TNM27766.1 protein kinase family protein [Streptomyces sedi]
MSRGARLAAHGAVSTSLALRGDRELRALVDAATPIGSGIGGRTLLLEVDGTPVFVKQVPLTDLERRPENVHSTANLFGMPSYCRYGVGPVCSPGFGAWRELAVHAMTTNWVIAGDYEGFPLTYHWRVLPGAEQPLPEELADVEGVVDFWGERSGIRRRVEALRQSTASLVLFLEYIPQTLHDWLGVQFATGDEAAERACAMVDDALEAGTSFMNAHGLSHFDAHFQNILTDGQRLYFADYGLAASSRFALAPDEADFHARHRSYDRCYTASYFVHWLVSALYGYGYGTDDRAALVRGWAEGERPTGVPETIAAILTRYASLSTVMWDFIRTLREENREAPFPLEAIRRMGPVAGPTRLPS